MKQRDNHIDKTKTIGNSNGFMVERMTRIELAMPAWEAGVLPLNYIRIYPEL